MCDVWCARAAVVVNACMNIANLTNHQLSKVPSTHAVQLGTAGLLGNLRSVFLKHAILLHSVSLSQCRPPFSSS